MRGSIVPGRSSGIWYLRVELQLTASGKRQRKRETFNGTKAEAQKRLREFIREVETGTVALERLTVSDLAHRWLASVEHRVGGRTFIRYSQLVNDYIVPRLGAIKAENLRPVQIEESIAAWRKTKIGKKDRVLSDRSVRHAFDTLRALCRWCFRMNLLPRNPCEAVTPPRWEQREMNTLDQKSLGALLEAARGTELEIPIIIMVGTGLRRGEAFGLRWSDIDLVQARLTVRRSIEVVGKIRREKPPKTARSTRTIALAPFVVNALRRQRHEQLERRMMLGLGKDDDCYVFDRVDGSAWDPELFGWRFADLVTRKKLPKIRLHDLRHSYATFLLSAGADLKVISNSLGHSTIAITANTYAHVTDSLHKENATRLDNLLGGVIERPIQAQPEGLGPHSAHNKPLLKQKPRIHAVSLVAPAGFEPALPP